MEKIYNFRIMGKVKAKQSVKFARIGNFIRKYTPDDITNYANWVKTCFKDVYPDALPSDLEGYNLSVVLTVNFAYPKSFSKKKIELAEKGIIKPTVKPDWDNISKNICDALNDVAYPDDRAIVCGQVSKVYGNDNFVDVMIIGKKWE